MVEVEVPLLTRRLGEIVALFAVAIEEASDDAIDPDFAVQLGEDIAYELRQLSPAEQADYVRLLSVIADETADVRKAAAIRALPDEFGIGSS